MHENPKYLAQEILALFTLLFFIVSYNDWLSEVIQE